MHPIKHRFRTGLLIGMGIGYVLGTRAGRERYEQLKGLWEKARNSPAMQQARDAAGMAVAQIEDKVESRNGKDLSGRGVPGRPGREGEYANLTGPGTNP